MTPAHEPLRRDAVAWYGVGAGALFVVAAAVARPAGVVLVLPFLIAASAAWLDAALRFTRIDSPTTRWAIYGAFGVRWTLAIALYCASLYQWPIGRSLQAGNGFWTFCMDALNYHAWAPQIANAVRYGFSLPNPGAALDYYLVVALIYWLFGTSPLTAIAINIFAWTLATICLIALFTHLRGRTVPPMVVVAISFWPSGLIWPTQVMKDSVVVLFLVVAVWLGAVLIEARRALKAFAIPMLLWLALVPLLRMRLYVGRILFASTLVAFITALVWLLKDRSAGRRAAAVLLTASTVWIGVVLIGAPDPFAVLAPPDPARGFVRYARHLEETGQLLQAREAYAQALALDPDATAPSAGDEPILTVGIVIRRIAQSVRGAMSRVFTDLIGNFLSMAPGALGSARSKFVAAGGNSAIASEVLWSTLYTILAPFPWDVLRPRGITGALRTFAVVESMLLYFLLPAIVLGFLRLRRPDELFVAALAGGGLFALGLVVTNLGTLFRLRVAFILIFAAFAVYGADVYSLIPERLRLRRPAPHVSQPSELA